MVYVLLTLALLLHPLTVLATPFTTNVPGTSLVLPTEYPAAGGVAIVMVGANGNAYFQFSNPTGAFVGYNNSGDPVAFQGNPFTINNPIALNCGFSPCSTYFGGSIAQVYIRFTASDGDTSSGNFDFNDITLRLNGFDVANWSSITTQTTNTAGTTAIGANHLGFGNNLFDTGWFTSTNAALLANILSTGSTSTQVFDRDPNDNYWDFRQGNTLANPAIVTVAPGYSLTKTPSTTTFTAVGQVVSYSYVVTNIGSVPIRNLSLSDNKIGTVSCNKTVIMSVNMGQTPDSAICTASYTITQADFDIERVTNIANAVGTPDYGTLGVLTATATVTGPPIAPAISLAKTSTLTAFGAVGTTVPYSFRVTNTGNATLTNVVVTDPRVPGLSCTTASLAPAAQLNCSAVYTVTQADLDAFAAGTNLINTASVTSRDSKNAARTATSSLSLPGPAPVVTMFLDKTTTATTYATVGQVLPYQILVRNTGNVTWPAAPTVTDSKTAVSCPAGAVAPGASITCSGNYAVTQADLDAGSLVNTASGTITVTGRTATATDTVTLNATRTPAFTLDKRLAVASPTSFSATGVSLSYAYDLANTGNVTLNTVAVTDNRTTVSCPATTIAPGTTLTCTATYVTTQADLNAGGVTNTASATARTAGPVTNVTSNSDSVTVPAVQQPALSMTKTAPTLTALQFTVGRVVTYSYTITNSGNVDLIAANQLTITDNKIGTFNCGSGIFLRTTSRTCTATYTLTSADVLAGLVSNTATSNSGSTTSNQVTATIAPTLSPALTLVKTANPTSVSATTNVISYTFTVTNSGNTQIIRSAQPISINDPMLAGVSCAAQPAVLNPTESFACTASYSPTQAQLDAGQVTNTATASFPYNASTVITSPSSSARVSVVETPSLSLDKTGPTNFTAVGQVLSYGFAVRNTGNTTLTSTTVTDPKIPGLSCTLTTIAPGATKSCTGSYTVTQADMDAGAVSNTATAQGATAAGGSAFGSDTVAVPVSPSVVLKSATFTKLANRTTFAAVGDSITYTMRVSNTGAQTLRNISVTDVLNASFNCAIPVLSPGAVNNTCTMTYVVTQADFDAGQVVNTASAASADFTTLTSGLTVTGPARTAAFTLTKAASGPYAAAGDVVTFSFTVSNTGNTTLSNLTVSDPFFSPALSCPIASLAPAATNAFCTASYTVTQTDVDRGQITNTASASGSAPAGVTAPTSQSSTVVVAGPTRAPSVEITKTPDTASFAAVGSTVAYTFSVTNTGNVSLGGLVVSDAALGFSCNLANLAPGATATTCSGGAPALSASRVMTQADVDSGNYTNTAGVIGQSLIAWTAVSDTDIVTVLGPAQSPTISLTKTSGLVGTYDSVGQTVPYSYTITNTGNITLTGAFSVADNKIALVSCPSVPAAGVAPGGTLVCAGSYTITQADLNAGQVVNLATAQVVQSVVAQNPGDPTSVTASSSQASETVTAAQLPQLTIVKRVKAGSAASYGVVGDVVTFEYVVTNAGNVTTTAPITVSDDKIAGILTCGAAGLAPGSSVTCDQDWTATQTAIDTGEVVNTAFARTVFDAANVDSATDSVTITAVQDASLAVVKTFTGTDAPGLFNVGDTLSYTIVVTNSGNVTIDGPITLNDNLTTPVCPALPGNVLAPGDTLNCTSTHVVTNNDVNLGAATNVVFATGSFDGSAVVSPSDDAIYPIAANPALSLTKAAVAGAIPFDAAGDTITYRYTLDNTGNVSLPRAIFITDDKLGGGPRLCKPARPFGTNAPPVTCDFVYTVTQADVDAGEVTNNATASTTFGPLATATTVVSPNATATVQGVETPELTVTKTVSAGPNPAAVGDVLTYRISTINTGNQTISGVTTTDDKVDPMTCTVNGAAAPANVVLAPLAELICTAPYTVKQSDVDAQVLTNTATSQGVDPQGATITDSGSVTAPLQAANPSVEVTKIVEPAPGPDDSFAAVGQPVTFRVTVLNTGNITLSSSTVTDDLVAGSCAVPALAPGESDTSCTFVVIATQADIDALYGPVGGQQFGGITNTASVSSQPATPGSPTVTDTGTAFAKGPDHSLALSLLKSTTATSFSAYGEVIPYTFVVANAGNVTLTAPIQITDALLGAPFDCGIMPPGGLLPGEFLTCTGNYTVSQADVDAGSLTNTARAASTEVPYPSDPALQAPVTSSVTLTGSRNPALSIDKTADILIDAEAGDVVTYTYVVTNTGNVTLTAVTPDDQQTNAAGTVTLALAGDALRSDIAETGNTTDAAANGIWDNLGPGDTISFSASYTVTQADVDAGAALINTVTVGAQSPAGTTALSADDSLTIPVIAAAPSLLVIKSADTVGIASPPAVGNVIAYSITVANAGNVTLTAPTMTDTLSLGVGPGGAVILPAPVTTYVSGDANSDGLLDVTETWTYSTSFALTQAAIDAGGVSNAATAAARDPNNTAVSDLSDNDGTGASDPTTTTLTSAPRLELVKTATLQDGGDGRADAGDRIDYTYVASNTGNVTVFDLTIVETGFGGTGTVPVPLRTAGGAALGGTSGLNDVSVGASITYQVSYVLTQADIDAGEVLNQATVAGTDPAGTAVSDLSGADAASDAVTETVLTAAAALDVQKRADISGLSAPIAVGDVIAYTVTAQNTGNVSLNAPLITDTLRDANGVVRPLSAAPAYSSGDSNTDGILDVGETWTYLANVQLTQAIIDAGGVSNLATVAATTPAGASVSDISDDDGTGTSDPTVTPLAATPGLEALKIIDVSGLASPPAAGNVIGYAISVRNAGNVTLDGITFTDTLTNLAGDTLTLTAGPSYLSGDSGTDSLLGVGESWSYDASYVITQADIDSGQVSNTITFNATAPDGSALSDVSDDDGIGSSDPTVQALTQTASLTALKSATLDLGSDGVATVGDLIRYSYSLQNTGNVTVYDVMMTETGFTGSGTAPFPAYGGGGATLGGIAGIPDLAVGATATYTADYALTQADIDLGQVVNSATGSGLAPDGSTVSDISGSAANNDTPTQVDLAEAPGLDVVKTADLSGLSNPVAAGDVVDFTVTVENTGNVSLSSPTVSDDFSRRDGTPGTLTLGYVAGDAGVTGTLDVAEVWTYTASYSLTQADIDAGGFSNSATGLATTPGGASVSDISDNGNDSDGNTVDDPTLVDTPAQARIEITKALAAGSPAPYDQVGQVLTYELTLLNAGNITLTAATLVSDPLVDGTPGRVQCPSGPIAPAASVTCSASYTVTQADLDLGSVSNTAEVAMTQSVVALNPGDPTTVQLNDTSNTVVATGSRLPELALAKTVASGSANSFDAVGDQITFRYTLSNLGNVSLSGPFTVTDDKIAGTLACGAGPLAPGAQLTCTQIWTATQADLDAASGSVTNTATATGSFAGTAVTSPADQVTVLAVQSAELALVKTIRSATPDRFDAGTVLDYDLIVSNPGNTTIAGPITVADSLASVSCPATPVGGLVPGASLTCTASYTLVASDIQLGATTNTATAFGNFAGSPVISPTASATYPVGASPVLTLTKDSDPSNASFTAVGGVISYVYSVTNTGLVGLTGDLTLTDNRLAAPFVCRPASAGVFAVGAVATCTADYTVTQADLDAGFVTNEALATAVFAIGTPNERSVTSNPATKTVTATAAPALSVVKSVTSGPSLAALGDQLDYLVQVENTGNQTLLAVNVDDPRLPGLACTQAGAPVAQPIVMAPGDVLQCAETYTVTQADIDAQSLINTASASGVAPDGSAVTAQGQHDQPLVAASPAMLLIKSLQPDPGSAPAFTAAGDVLTFRATLTNTGNVTLTGGSITDTLVPGACAVPSLAPGVSFAACSFDYTATQADVDRVQISAPAQGGLVNQVDSEAQPANPGAPSILATDSLTVLGPLHQPSFGLEKSADVASASAFGDQITYDYLVTNTGNITLLAQPVISDDKIAVVTCPTLPVTGLAPAAAITCTATYSVTQADVDAGEVTNNAGVTSAEVTLPGTDSLTVPITASPGLTVVKTASVTAGVMAGDVIDYSYVVTNTGNVSLGAVTLDDQHSTAAGTAALPVAGDTLITDAGEVGNATDANADGVWDTFGPGDVVSFTANYTVTQADVDAGVALSNLVSVTATTPTGPLADPATDSASVSLQPAAPAIEVVKTVNLGGASNPPVEGDILPFTITLANTGNVSLTGLSLVDTFRRNDGSALTLVPVYSSGDGGAAGVLDVAEVWTYTASHTLTQADVDAGGVINQVLTTATAPDGEIVRDLSDDDVTPGGDDPTRVLIPLMPALVGEKTITAAPTIVGGVVEFLITATNAGNVSLSNVAVASDRLTRADGTALVLDSGPSFDGASLGSGAGQLLPGEIARYVATYTLTQADIDAGGIANSATLRGTTSSGSPVTDVTDNGDDGDGNTVDDPTQLPLTGTASLALVKRLAATSGPSFAAPGETLQYEFVVRNTGTLTLPGPVTVADPLIAAVTCPAGALAPAGQMICTGTYRVTQADVDSGQITNTATASAGAATSAPATRVVPAQQARAMSLVKTADPIAVSEFVVGAQVTYTYTVTNSGNVTLTAPIRISDNLIAPANLTCPPLPPLGLAPAAQLVCTGNYTVTAADVDLGSVTNLASSGDGTTTSPLATETVPDSATPALVVVKTATSGADFAAVGDVIDYRYVVTNTGRRSFAAPVSVMDDKLGEIACFAPSVSDPDLRPGESVTCRASHIVTEADLDAGQVTNQAYARTTFGGGAVEVVSAPDTVTVEAAQNPELVLVKTATPASVLVVGQVVRYDLTTQNSGNQTLRAVEITDPMFPGLVCQIDALLPGESLPCGADYTVTQADIDRGGSLLNTATATALTPRGTSVSAVDTASVTMPAANPALTLQKTALPSPFGAAGSQLTYVFAVTNSGNVSLSNLVVTDPMDASFECLIAQLAPGAGSTACRMTVTITQAQVDAGSITNTASVSATVPDGSTATAADTVTTAGPARVPGLEATKTALASGTGLGAEVRYQLALRNTGNLSLVPSAPVDIMTRLDGSATSLDAPFARVSGDDGNDILDLDEVWIYEASHIITQADIDAGGLSNQVNALAAVTGGGGVSDLSDNGDDSDGNSIDDPTLFPIVPGPALHVSKVISDLTGQGVGDRVTFTITATNTGSVTLTNLTLTDSLTRADGSILATDPLTGGASSLVPGEAADWQLVHVLTKADIDAGGIVNTATVSGQDPSGAGVSDASDNGDNTDGNITDDPTRLTITATSTLSVLKVLDSIGAAPGEEAVFTITARNTGNVTLSAVSASDSLSRLDGSAVGAQVLQFVSNSAGSPEGMLEAGETATWTLRYVLTQADLDAGGLSNTATVAGTTPLGVVVSDLSDDDGAGDSDPTLAILTAVPSLEVVKSATPPRFLFPTVTEVTFTLAVTNTSTITQTGISLRDDLAAFLAPAVLDADYDVALTATGFAAGGANPAYDGASVTETLTGNATLSPGQTGTVAITLVYSSAAGQPSAENVGFAASDQHPAAEPSNPVALVQTDSDGDGILDSDEGPGDRDGDGIDNASDYDPTGAFYCEDTGQLLTGGRIRVSGPFGAQDGIGSSNGITIIRDGSDGNYQFFVTRAGTYRLEVSYPPGTSPSTTRLDGGVLDLSSLLPANPASLGSGPDGNSGQLVDFSANANRFFLTFEVKAGDPHLINNNIPLIGCSGGGGDVVATKIADRSTAVFGETVNFTLTYDNATTASFTGATFVDQLPEGLVYTPGSASLDGVAIEPAVQGRQLTFGPLDVAAQQKLVLRLAARVATTSAGALVNQSFMLDANGAQVSNTATATVRIQPEAVFECSDVIGKVFHDENGNGVQDGPNGLPPLTDDDIFTGGKYGKLSPPKPLPKGYESGLPGVRLVTVNGLLITTDEFGRFHVPCAALPKSNGSNFTLKLDTRTLPLGYQVTTENPRVLRLTPGKVAKMNFGAASANQVDITLTAEAFDGDLPSSGLRHAITNLVTRMQETPTALRLAYLLGAQESVDQGMSRLKSVESAIRKAWRAVGGYDLSISREVLRQKDK